jgi:hypothetical protein
MRRPRLRTAFALLALVVAGVVVARTVPDPVGDIGGDVLYAAWAVDIAARSYTRKRRWTCS